MACAPVICVCRGNPLTSSWHGRAVAGGAVGNVQLSQTSTSALAAQLREVSSGLAAPWVDTFTGVFVNNNPGFILVLDRSRPVQPVQQLLWRQRFSAGFCASPAALT